MAITGSAQCEAKGGHLVSFCCQHNHMHYTCTSICHVQCTMTTADGFMWQIQYMYTLWMCTELCNVYWNISNTHLCIVFISTFMKVTRVMCFTNSTPLDTIVCMFETDHFELPMDSVRWHNGTECILCCQRMHYSMINLKPNSYVWDLFEAQFTNNWLTVHTHILFTVGHILGNSFIYSMC